MARGARAKLTRNKYTEYVLYAQHCLGMAKMAPDQQARMIQRDMAAEWLKLADQLES